MPPGAAPAEGLASDGHGLQYSPVSFLRLQPPKWQCVLQKPRDQQL